MKIKIAQTAGFCFGVERAVEMAEKQAAESGRIYAYGEIIHNKHEIQRLAARGVQTAEELDAIPDGAPVLIRAHGNGKAVFDALKEKQCRVYDATCPFVRKIHRIVQKESEDGRKILIFGSKNHPEVIGIQGWCGDSFAFKTNEELEEALQTGEILQDMPLCLIAQTTVNRELWNISVSFLKKRCTNLKIFDTICKATDERQTEARLLAGEAEQMIVIGDKKSSNTRRLYEISCSLCGDVVYVEDAQELKDTSFAAKSKIGITAGASTPAWIIKEVSNMMSEETKIANEDFAAMLEESFKTLNTGEKVTGVVVAVSSTDVQVDLGVKHTAYIPLSELSDDPSFDVSENIKPGDEVEAIVVRVNDGEGTITLSKKRVDQLRGWDSIEEAHEKHEIVEGTIIEENRGGVVATANGVRVFIPASQTGVPKDQDMGRIMHTKQKFYITEINRQRRRVVGSIRQIQSELRKEAAEKVWSSIDVGAEYDGVVKSITSYGVFVDIGGVDGMVHISELSWGRIKHPSEVVSIGDQIHVFVIGLDREAKKISLGYKKETENPWNVFKSQYDIGSVATVKILKFMPFGAFAEIVPGVDGLIHISQIADHHVAKPEDELTVGQQVDAKIIDINDEKKKVSLSIRALLVPEMDENGEEDYE